MCLFNMSDRFGGDLTITSCPGDALKNVTFAYSIGVSVLGRSLLFTKTKVELTIEKLTVKL